MSNLTRAPSEVFSSIRTLKVRQRRKWLEAIFSLEFKNQYDLFDEDGRAILKVQEEGNGFLSLLKRLFMGPIRPFDATVSDANGAHVLTLRRRFRFMFHRLEVEDAHGRLLGAVQKRWSWVRRIYSVEGPEGRERLQLFGPIFKPWTFEIREGERQVGVLRKRWSGMVNELFTDADQFGVEVGDIASPDDRALTVAATVLVDVVHFERSKN